MSDQTLGDRLEFRSILTLGGHSTYRVYLFGNSLITDDDIQEFWKPIAALGATHESANGSFFAVDIPPGSNMEEIYRLLEAGEAAEIWEFEEASFEPASDDTTNEQ